MSFSMGLAKIVEEELSGSGIQQPVRLADSQDYIKRFALRPRRRRVGRSERRTELLLGEKSISARERQQGLAGRPSI